MKPFLLLRGLLCGSSGGGGGGGSNSSSTVITRPGLFDATPDVSVMLVAPGPTVSAAVTGPDKGVASVDEQQQQETDGAAIPWQHSTEQPPPPQQQQACWGSAVSLYDVDPLTGQRNGDPVADCFACIAYQQGAVLALADGVNWGQKPKQAARAAVLGFCCSLHQQLAQTQGGRKLSSAAAVGAMRAAVLAAQRQILAADGTCTTLVGAVVCPKRWGGGHVLLAVAVGDSPCYVWRAGSGTVEEVTYVPPLHGFHRDPRVCPGCLGYALGDQPDLSNVTFSLTHLQQGDLVFLTSDGVADNFDPVMRKQALATALPGKSPRASAAAQAAAFNALNGLQEQPESLELASVSPATCHARALTDMAKVLRCACDPEQQQQQQQQGQQQQQQQGVGVTQASAAAAAQGVTDGSLGTTSLASSGGGKQPLNAASCGASLKSVSRELPAGFTAGSSLTAAAAVDALIGFATSVTDAQRRVLQDAAAGKSSSSSSSRSKQELGDVLAGLPGKLDHACVVAYKVGSGR